jgi:hypothetical protein
MHSKTSKNKKFILGALAVLILILGAFFIFKRQPAVDVSAAGENWMMMRFPGFTYKRQIDINNQSGVNLTDYQIKIIVNYSSEMQPDFDDIRFTLIDGVTLIPYWLESKTDYGTATFWVKVPSIPASGNLTYLYMWYGNGSASSLSSGTDTFDFFDDFIGTSFDSTKWTGAGAVSNSIVTVPMTGTISTSTLNSISTFGNGYSFRSRVSVASPSSYAGWGFRSSDNNDTDMFYVSWPTAGKFGAISRVNPQRTDVEINYSSTGYHVYEVSRNATTSAIYSIDNTVYCTTSTTLPTGQLPASFYAHQQVVSVDWVAVRKYVALEPTYITDNTGDIKMWAQQLSTAGGKAWNFRKAITINNPGTALTDYQIPITIVYDSDMQADFDDLRFTSSDGSTLLPYWLESKTDSTTAKVWVKVPTISASAATTIYMYYGNGWTGPGSDGNNTFIFFDDFNTGLSKWIQSSGTAVAPGWVLSNGELKGTNTKDRLKSISTFSVATTPFVLETKHRYVTMSDMGFMSGGFYSSAYNGLGIANYAPHYYFNNNWITLPGGGSGSPSATNLLTKITAKSNTAVDLSIANYATGASYGSVSNINRSITSMPIALGERYDDDYFYNYETYWDWVIVHKYSPVVPTVTFYPEEAPTGICGPSNGQYFQTSAPTTGLCVSGIPSTTSANGAGIWTWTCLGVGETLPTNCSTSRFTGRYIRSIPIINSGGVLTDYQVPITIAYDSDMQADFDDLRFTSSDGSTLLPYWIESKTDSTTAKVWVKVSTISASATTTIYMYYGNSSAVSASDGTSTFAFFDDFNGSSLDTTKWTDTTSSGIRTFANSLMSVYISGTSDWNTITAKTDTNNATVVTGAKLRSNAATAIDCDARVGIKTTGNSVGAKIALHANPSLYIVPLNESVAWGTNLQTFSLGTWYTLELRHDYSSTFYYRVGQSGAWNSWAINPAGTHISLSVLGFSSGIANSDFDWIYQRKYTATEPTVGSFGTETSTINICGSADGTYVASAPTTNLCSDGSTPSVAGIGPWYWTCSVSGGAPSSCMAYASSGLPSLSGWSYKKLVTVSSSSTLTNYAMKIDIPFISGKMKSDFSDLRFAKSDGTIYPYWIEKINDDGSARAWVKVPSIAITPATTFYMYYGNSSAPSVSSGDNTFIFFDDFSGTIINTTKWVKTDTNGFISQNETLNISGGDKDWNHTIMYTSSNFNRSDSLAVQSKYKATEVRGTNFYEYTTIGTTDSTASFFIYGLSGYAVKSESLFHIIENSSMAYWGISQFSAAQQYDARQIIKTGNGATTQLSQNSGDTWSTLYDSTTAGQSTFKVGIEHYQGGDTIIDNIIVRKYVSIEPTATLGPEILISSGGPTAVNLWTAGEWDNIWYCDKYFQTGSLLNGHSGNLEFNFEYSDTNPSAKITSYYIRVGTSSDPDEAQIKIGPVNLTSAQNIGYTIAHGGISAKQAWSTVVPYQIPYGDGTTHAQYHWWIKVVNNNTPTPQESSWVEAPEQVGAGTGIGLAVPAKHFPIVRVVPVAAAVNTNIQLCSGTDISNPGATCYSTCWTGTGAAVVDPDNSNWKCSVCYNSSGLPVSCSTNGNAITWTIPGTLGVDYSFTSGNSTSANPVVQFTSVSSKTIGLDVHGSNCGNQGIFNVGAAASLLPKWKEVSPF